METSKTFLYLEIAESLRRRIASGEFQPDDRLPSMREMARQWHCTPGTVSRAYAQLAQEGLTSGRRGGGTRVASSSFGSDHPTWQWAGLVNRAERFLLEAINSGYTPAQAESALSVAVSRWQDLQRQSISPTPSTANDPTGVTKLRFAGSHDLAVEILARMLGEEMPGARLSIDYVGSLGGLMALARGEADIAGIHLWDETSDEYNVPFIRRLLPGNKVVLITLAHRSLGFITPPGNPQEIHSLEDLLRPGVRMVNRQAGSGTRVWLDAHLKTLSIPSASVEGYEWEELTHLAVAQMVYQGKATVGLGIFAAASAYGLDFVHLTEERYDLVLLEAVWHLPSTQALSAIIRSARFEESVAALGGYGTSYAGQQVWIS